MAEWQIRTGGKDYHAKDLEQIKEWARQGRIRPETVVYDPRSDRWVKASEVNDLLGILPEVHQPAPKKGSSPGQLGCLGLLLIPFGLFVGGSLMNSSLIAIVCVALGIGAILAALVMAVARR